MIELSLSLVFVALIARDCFRFWVKSLDVSVYQGKQIEMLKGKLSELERDQGVNVAEQAAIVKKLAEDWALKFRQLENGNAEMRKHIDTQVAGTIAQLPATGRGFGR